MTQSLFSTIFSKIFKLVMFVLMIGAIFGFVLVDVGSFFKSGAVSRTDVAQVGHEKINANEFSQTLRRKLMQAGFTDEQAQQMGVPYLILQQEITRLTLIQAAKQSGIRISDLHVAKNLKEQLDKTGLPGSDADKLNLVLRQQGISENDFVELLRGDFAVNLLASAVATTDQAIPDQLAESAYRFAREKRDVALVQLSNTNLKVLPQLDDKAVEAYFNENKEKYRSTAKRDIAYVVLSTKALLPEVAISDEVIKNYYDSHQDQFMDPERVYMTQIITKDEKTAQKIYDQKPNDITKIAMKDADILPKDWYSRNALGKDLEATIFEDKKVGLLPPVKSDLGWHVVQIEKYDTAKPKEFNKVKEIIARTMKDEQLDNALNTIIKRIEELSQSSDSLQPLADEFKVPLQTVENIEQKNAPEILKTAGVPDMVAARLQEATFSLEDKEISPIIDTKEGDMILVQVSKEVPAAIPLFESIKDVVRIDAAKQTTEEKLQDLSIELTSSFDSKEKDSWSKKLSTHSLSEEILSDLDRSSAVQKIGDPATQLLFSLNTKNSVTSLPNEKGILIIRLVDVKPYMDPVSNDMLGQEAQRIKNETAQEVQEQFVSAWRNQLGVSINDTLMQSFFMNKKN